MKHVKCPIAAVYRAGGATKAVEPLHVVSRERVFLTINEHWYR
jgi:hypothetical protein